jgi:hypothetical protein
VESRAFFDRWLTAMNKLDFAALEPMLHRDFTAIYPQSGEILRGFEAFRAMLELYPGGLERGSSDIENTTVVDSDERWAISPGYTVVPLAQPGRYTTLTRISYPDGSWWRAITLVELRDDKVYRAESYFAPEMPAPIGDALPRLGGI